MPEEVLQSIATRELELTNLNKSGQDVTVGDAVNFILNTTTGTKIGTATSQKLGFWNATPVVQQSAIADPSSDTASNNAAIDSILAMLRTLGIIAT